MIPKSIKNFYCMSIVVALRYLHIQDMQLDMKIEVETCSQVGTDGLGLE